MAPPPMPAPPPEMQWQRLHVASPILNAISAAIRIWPVFVVAIVNERSGLTVGILTLVVAGIVVLEAIKYVRFEYRLEGSTLAVRSGVLVRTTRTVPADRVQQVSRNERLRHRLFNVTELLVEVAGSGSEPDISLSVLDVPEADRVASRLQSARRAPGATPPLAPTIVYEQPNASLFRWAAYASPLFMLPAVGAGVGYLAEAVDLEDAWEWLPADSRLAGVAVIAVVGLAVATAINVARYYDMRLVQADDNLLLEYGLLTHRRLELPVPRVQAIVTKVTPAGHLAGTVGITAHNASSAGDVTNSYMPAVPRGDRRSIAQRLLPDQRLDPPLQSHPRNALRRSLVRWTVPLVVISGVLAFLAPGLWRGAGMLLVPAAAALGWRAWRLLGHGDTHGLVRARHGAITVHDTSARRDRIQGVSVVANFFQRRLGLATLVIAMAQPLGRVVVRDMAAADAARLAADLASKRQQRESEEGSEE